MTEAFNRSGADKSEFEVTKWGKDKKGKSIPVEWKVTEGKNKRAEVNMDFGHEKNGPADPHVGYQTAGKRSDGGGQRGHTSSTRSGYLRFKMNINLFKEVEDAAFKYRRLYRIRILYH